jgi:hypothetical protein
MNICRSKRPIQKRSRRRVISVQRYGLILRRQHCFTSHFDQIQYPGRCPTLYCTDIFPDQPDKAVVKAYEKYQGTINGKGELGQGGAIAAMSLCTAIKAYHRAADEVKYAADQEWPLEINFRCLPERVMIIKGALDSLIKDETVLATSVAWKSFIQKLAESGVALRRFRNLNWTKKQEIYSTPAG